MELVIAIIAGILFGYFWVWVTKPLERRGWGHVKKFHIHHSVMGLAISIIGLFIVNWQFAIFGIGMVIHHLISEGPQFITKD